VRVAREPPSKGSTAAERSEASAADQAGLTSPESGSGRPASIRASGKPDTSSFVIFRSRAASARYSFSERFNAANARESYAASRQRAK